MIAAMTSPVAISTTAPANTTTGAPASGANAPADFLLMLGQLVASSPEAAAAGASTNTQWRKGAISPEELLDEESAAAILAGMLAIAAPAAPASPPSATNTPDLMAELELSRDAVGARIPQLGADAGALTDVISSEPGEGADLLTTFESALSPHTSRETQSASRVLMGNEASLTRTVHTPVGSAAWADEIGSRLTMMAEQGKQTASLRLSPEHLGPLEIRISIRDDQASVWFGAAHADTRAAIEHALPRLRELFESQGMSLADAGVHHEPPREQATADKRASASTTDANGDEPPTPALMKLKLGLVDAYA
jgi:flagellar hook-length control protein FliK